MPKKLIQGCENGSTPFALKLILSFLVKGSLKKIVEPVSMLIPPSDPTPPTVSALGNFFLRRFLDYWGRLVRGETDIIKFGLNLIKTTQNKDGQNLTY